MATNTALAMTQVPPRLINDSQVSTDLLQPAHISRTLRVTLLVSCAQTDSWVQTKGLDPYYSLFTSRIDTLIAGQQPLPCAIISGSLLPSQTWPCRCSQDSCLSTFAPTV